MRSCFIALALMPMVASANALTLDEALRATYTACVGIDDELADLKKMAGINTAVTAAGAAAGTGAIATGVIKKRTDTEIADIEQRLQSLIDEQNKNDETSVIVVANREDFKAQIKSILESYQGEDKTSKETDLENLNKLDPQSKKLGNWRTGLLAANTATNIAGAAIAGTNKVDKELDAQIHDCVSAVNNLRASMMQAQLDGLDITEARTIADACDDYATVDTTKINKRATGAMVSSAVGAATGAAGTIASVMANTDTTRNDNTESGKQKENNLNTAANALSVGATVASVSATVFNSAQIAAIKKVASVSEKCTEVLK